LTPDGGMLIRFAVSSEQNCQSVSTALHEQRRSLLPQKWGLRLPAGNSHFFNMTPQNLRFRQITDWSVIGVQFLSLTFFECLFNCLAGFFSFA
jgi:hypothetical protein